MTTAPNTQSYPEMGYPAAAYYGINASLQEQKAFTASSGSANSTTALAASGASNRTLIVAVLIVLAVAAIWHFYYKK